MHSRDILDLLVATAALLAYILHRNRDLESSSSLTGIMHHTACLMLVSAAAVAIAAPIGVDTGSAVTNNTGRNANLQPQQIPLVDTGILPSLDDELPSIAIHATSAANQAVDPFNATPCTNANDLHTAPSWAPFTILQQLWNLGSWAWILPAKYIPEPPTCETHGYMLVPLGFEEWQPVPC